MSVRTTVYLSEETRNKLDKFKENNPEISLNISAICEKAILQALHRYKE
jgi:hypothetical protein